MKDLIAVDIGNQVINDRLLHGSELTLDQAITISLVDEESREGMNLMENSDTKTAHAVQGKRRERGMIRIDELRIIHNKEKSTGRCKEITVVQGVKHTNRSTVPSLWEDLSYLQGEKLLWQDMLEQIEESVEEVHLDTSTSDLSENAFCMNRFKMT
ncbi:hypothetical protein PoB_001558200 [Plakobranchus ocellatus]|uniref:Uncharacterized protein n=1 Tax=Plakobranchus ocellatus TaxID=259542 RepID=A0AAV3Z3J5_9GAST|nr:hypothetical protein PoB_001558200 [Plakobranchus ocellatus]